MQRDIPFSVQKARQNATFPYPLSRSLWPTRLVPNNATRIKQPRSKEMRNWHRFRFPPVLALIGIIALSSVGQAGTLSQGQINGFPNYFLGFQRQVSTHFMFRLCTERVRATPFDFGADEYIGLELYTAWRGRGLPVETPAVR